MIRKSLRHVQQNATKKKKERKHLTSNIFQLWKSATSVQQQQKQGLLFCCKKTMWAPAVASAKAAVPDYIHYTLLWLPRVLIKDSIQWSSSNLSHSKSFLNARFNFRFTLRVLDGAFFWPQGIHWTTAGQPECLHAIQTYIIRITV